MITTANKEYHTMKNRVSKTDEKLIRLDERAKLANKLAEQIRRAKSVKKAKIIAHKAAQEACDEMDKILGPFKNNPFAGEDEGFNMVIDMLKESGAMDIRGIIDNDLLESHIKKS